MSLFKPSNNPNAVLDRPRAARPPRVNYNPAFTPAVTTPAASVPPAIVETTTPTERASLALWVATIFMFFRFSFLHEWLAAKVGFDSHLLLILGATALLAALFSGGLVNAFSSKICLAWLGFAGCMTAATAGSIWRGGSFAVLFPYLRTTMILVILIPAVAVSTRSIARAMKAAGLAGLSVVIMGLTSNDFRSGRLELSGAGASIENSNDYAALLMFLMPAMAYLTMRKSNSIFLKIVGIAALCGGCFLILSTGSRGALISMMLSVVYILKVGSGKVRLAILVGVPLVVLMAVPFIPKEASARLASLFGKDDNSALTEEAASSKQQRTELLMESLRFTLQHPLIGVGPGTFQVYQAQVAKDRGQLGMWHETHNSYTQVSSECGIPAFLFYVAAIIMSFVVFRRASKSPDPELKALASVLSLMLVSFCVCMFFLSQGYGFGFPVLGGFAISMERLLKQRETPAPAAA